jgi:hypothetical protein
MGFALEELAQFRESDRAVAIHPGDAAPRPRRLAADGAAYLMSQRRGAPQRQNIYSRSGPASTRAKPETSPLLGFRRMGLSRKVKTSDEETKLHLQLLRFWLRGDDGRAPPVPSRLVRRRRNPSRAFDCHHLGRASRLRAGGLLSDGGAVVVVGAVVPMAGWGRVFKSSSVELPRPSLQVSTETGQLPLQLQSDQ